MLAAGAWLGDWDNYYSSNNYRIYWNPSASRWFFIPTGIDQTFGEDSTRAFDGTGLLFRKCLSSKRCVQQYTATLRVVAVRIARRGLPARIDALLALIDSASQADPTKTYDAS